MSVKKDGIAEGLGQLIGLVVFPIIAIWLYYLFIKWLFVSIGPGFVYVTALMLSLAVPVVYSRSLTQIFRNDDKGTLSIIRTLLFIPALALVALIYIDLIHIFLNEGMLIFHVPFIETLNSYFGWISSGFIVNNKIIVITESIFSSYVKLTPLLLFSAAMKSVLIVPCLLVARGFSTEYILISSSDEQSQPARLSYFHGQALKDLVEMVKIMFNDLIRLILLVNKGIVAITIGAADTVVILVIIWPLIIMAYIALIPPIVVAIIASIIFIVMHSISLGFIWVLAMLISFLLLMMEKAVILSRAGYAKCPHAKCHAPVPLPIFLCPRCGAEHDKLIPSRFGVFTRTCKCGEHLPTLFWHGKGRLPSICPSCHNPMREELFGGSVHIPIYGGPSTGKTMYMMAILSKLLEKDVPNVVAHLIDEKIEKDYSQHWKPDFQEGMVRAKTVDAFPDAFLMSLRRGVGLPSSVYLYDPSGEALLQESNLDLHTFMKYFDGLALLIDPLSLPTFKNKYREKGGPDLTSTTSRVNPEQTLERVISLLERMGLSPSEKARKRIAVVFTKSDILGFTDEIGVDISARDLNSDWNNLGVEDSSKISGWLKDNEPHLFQLLEARFTEIRFFAVSSLGHSPQPGEAFVPTRVMEPFAWLLSTGSTFAYPLLGRILGRAREAFAVIAVFGFLVVFPIWTLFWWWL